MQSSFRRVGERLDSVRLVTLLTTLESCCYMGRTVLFPKRVAGVFGTFQLGKVESLTDNLPVKRKFNPYATVDISNPPWKGTGLHKCQPRVRLANNQVLSLGRGDLDNHPNLKGK